MHITDVTLYVTKRECSPKNVHIYRIETEKEFIRDSASANCSSTAYESSLVGNTTAYLKRQRPELAPGLTLSLCAAMNQSEAFVSTPILFLLR